MQIALYRLAARGRAGAQRAVVAVSHGDDPSATAKGCDSGWVRCRGNCARRCKASA